MKKKLLLSILAAGLVLPTAAALAQENEPKLKEVVNLAVNAKKAEETAVKIKALEAKIGDLNYDFEIATGKVVTALADVNKTKKEVAAQQEQVKRIENTLKWVANTSAAEEVKAKVNAAKTLLAEKEAALEAAKVVHANALAVLAPISKDLEKAKADLAKLKATPAEETKSEVKKAEPKKAEVAKPVVKKALPKTSAVK